MIDLSNFSRELSLREASINLGHAIVKGGVYEIVAREQFLDAWEIFVEKL